MDRETLKTLAEAATPGPYEWDAEQYVVRAKDGRIMFDRSCECDDEDHADAAYIAAAHPQAILALLAELARVEQERDSQWKAACEANALLHEWWQVAERRAEVAEAEVARLLAALRAVKTCPWRWNTGATFQDGVRVTCYRCDWCGATAKAEDTVPQHPSNDCLWHLAALAPSTAGRPTT